MFGLKSTFNGTATFTVQRGDKTITLYGIVESDTIKVNKQLFQDEILLDEKKNKYIVLRCDNNLPYSMYPYLLTVQHYNARTTNNINIGSISNSNVVLNSPNATIQQEINKLPPEVQAVAIELVSVLTEYLRTKVKPKNFVQKFGDFIAKYANVFTGIGGLALQVIPLLMGNA